MPRNLIAAAALAAALLPGAVAAAPADAAPMRTAKFTATFGASFTTTWTMPEHHVISDCYHQRFRSGAGTETWQVRPRGSARVAVTSGGRSTIFHMGTWETSGDPRREPLRAAGVHTRAGSHTDRTAPGECGGTPEVEVRRGEDCGTRLPRYEVSLSAVGGKLTPQLTADPAMRSEDVRFDDCPISLSDGLVDGAWPDVEARLPKGLFGRGKKPLVVKGRRAWRAERRTGRGHGVITTRSRLDWTLTLRRAR